MGQDDIIGWLRDKRLQGDCTFQSVLSIKDGLASKGDVGTIRIYQQCIQLYRFGVLEIRRDGITVIGYRLRKKYVGNEVEE